MDAQAITSVVPPELLASALILALACFMGCLAKWLTTLVDVEEPECECTDEATCDGCYAMWASGF